MPLIPTGTGKRGVAAGARAEVAARAGVDRVRSPDDRDPETERARKAKRVGAAAGADPETGAIQIEAAGTGVVEEGVGVEGGREAGPVPFTGGLPSK